MGDLIANSRISRKLSGNHIGPSQPKEGTVIRSIDIANELGFSKPSVSVAMKNLRENEYITVSPEGSISLLPAGQAIADKIYERHTLITDLLVALGVDPGGCRRGCLPDRACYQRRELCCHQKLTPGKTSRSC